VDIYAEWPSATLFAQRIPAAVALAGPIGAVAIWIKDDRERPVIAYNKMKDRTMNGKEE